MRMLKKYFILFMCVGCAQISSHSVDLSQYDIKEVCLQPVGRHIPFNFKYILKEQILHHNIVTKKYENNRKSCHYRLVYSLKAKVKNNMIYVKDVHLALYDGKKQIAYADRDAPNGFLGKEIGDLSKWDSTRFVVENLVNQLFGGKTSLKRSETSITER